MAHLLYRLGAFSVRRRRALLLAWPVVAAAVVVLGVVFAGSFQSSSTIPGSPAQRALDRMEQHFPPVGEGQSARIVVQAPAGRVLAEPPLTAAVRATVSEAAAVPGVAAVSDPFVSGTVSPDGRTALVQAELAVSEQDAVPEATLEGLRAAGEGAEAAGALVVLGGGAFEEEHPVVGPYEAASLLVALLVLVVTLGSLLAAGMPLLTALVGVAVAVTGMLGVASLVDVSGNAPALALMLGLAVGIDYALFIVSRHRSQLATGMPVAESVARAVATAGSAVVFAGATVVIALCGLTVAGVPSLTSMGLAAAAAVAVAVLVSLALLPALLAVAGERLVPRPGSGASRRTVDDSVRTAGERYVGAVTRRPLLAAVVSVAALAVVALPAAQLQLALTDDGSQAKSTSVRQGYDLVGEAFGPGANGPLVVLVTDQDPAGLRATADEVLADLRGAPGLVQVSDVEYAEDGAAARVRVIPATGPRDPATSDLVADLRALVAAAAGTGSEVSVTGATAVSIDVSDKLRAALVPFAVVVVGLSLLLLMVAFRSVAVPVKATVGFLLSVGAALGATVAVFQWGWMADVLGTPSTGPVASFVPIMVMAVLFGLAMDYEVFLVSSMREEYVRTGDARRAVVAGARHATRVVTAAALIMVAVFVGFVLPKDPDIMPIAWALAVGVLVDAFVVRMTLVPAVLTLLGDRAWWLPRWLDRRLPHLDVEGEGAATARTPGDRQLVGSGTGG